MTMIIDADVHISPIPGDPYNLHVEKLLDIMEKAEVNRAVTWPRAPYLRELDKPNEYVHNSMKKYPDKILGFGWVDPKLGVEKAKDMVKRCMYDYGFYGVKLNGAMNKYYIDDPVLSIPVIEEVVKTGKILALHVGADDYERTHPFRVGKIAKLFPEQPILMIHMGGASFDDMSDAAIEFAQEHPNITFIGSQIRIVAVLKAIRMLGASRVCFGSDTPFALMHVEVAKYNALLNGEVSGEEKQQVMGSNITRLFDLEI